jgi:hypothetical protein
MARIIRERPPLKVMLSILPPGVGGAARWASDHRKVQNVPDNLSFTTARGGFDQANCQLERDPRADWADVVEYADAQIVGIGGAQVAWEGRIEGYPSSGGQQSNLQPQLYGWKAHLADRTDAAGLYVDSSLPNWGSPTAARQAQLVAASYQIGDSSLGTDPLSGSNSALVQSFTGAWASGIKPICEAWYIAPPGCAIAKIYYAVDCDPAVGNGDSNWSIRAYLSSDDLQSAFEQTASLAGTGGAEISGLFAPGTPEPFAFVQFLYAASPAGTDSQQYDAYWNALQAFGNHGLTLRGSGPYGLLASDIVADALTKFAPKLNFTTGTNGSIQPSTFEIAQSLYSATTASAIVDDVTQYELLDMAIWENRTFYLNARGARGRRWKTRVGECQLQTTGPQSSNIFNGVIVQFTASDGTTQTVGPPGANVTVTDSSLADPDPENPATKAGLTIWSPPVSTDATTAAQAISIGQDFLAAQKTVDTSGSASLVAYVQDAVTGAFWPSYMVRFADTLEVTDAADPSPRRVVSTSYDNPSKTNTVQLDQPPDTFDAFLAEMGASLPALALS